jgi:hypothetical protein
MRDQVLSEFNSVSVYIFSFQIVNCNKVKNIVAPNKNGFPMIHSNVINEIVFNTI